MGVDAWLCESSSSHDGTNVDSADTDKVTFLHFNDAYNIGNNHLPRFAHALKRARDKYPSALTVFSGDAFSPSVEAAVLKGRHMVPVLNELQVDIACYGNHDFDFGEEVLLELKRACNFPWLMSNVVDSTGRLLADAKEYMVVTHQGCKLGFFALAGTDWSSNCQHLPPDVRIVDPVVTAQRVCRLLRDEYRVDLVIALTHMRLLEDRTVVAGCKDIDLILGGHDHEYMIDTTDKCVTIVKSGSDFCELSLVGLKLDSEMICILDVSVERIHSMSHPKDESMQAIIATIQKEMNAITDRELLYCDVELECRSVVGRTMETNMGNFLADILRAYYSCDIAVVNSGSIRCNKIIHNGKLTVQDVFGILPFGNIFVVKRISGRDLLTALENSVGDSRMDGRFLQLSGLQIIVDLSRPEEQRIVSAFYYTDGLREPVDPSKEYDVAMVNFIADGYDGYDAFCKSDHVIGPEAGITETAMLIETFDVSGDFSERGARARNKVVIEYRDGLPVVAPTLDNRIVFT
ncbi:uncharacterized protein SPPG_08200 [Spizellomyces punctatus DAOM BR117]|uniref:5'-Nucleotidase C-terminal domain-containing protein n=1 Tax=Spizellomyces punctatus (strain DAOM BR117) TaxID=645134 RepID=A0A0L0H7F5_SPIPD|nr:uncharacterized protein SPPG_08200 [Spizellomyces punctatus DAOM BR117]KNC96618.1 hypothetical protein SPPG_08200 [Spizellomyces punctatus DAOM BR117]|eukprot:XP_016604658.1 hypothetical protein SPPG_08200 [Spizellomyces punctatus DAOM BR117]